MVILGYNGFDGALSWRKQHHPTMSTQHIRMCQGLDTAACLIIDGILVAACEEERFNEEKFTCDFPKNAINFCLKIGNVRYDEIDFLCHSFDYEPYKSLFNLTPTSKSLYEEILSPEAQESLWRKYFPQVDAAFCATDHHLSHAASAYYPSGFDHSLILVVDGIGEIYSTSLYYVENGVMTHLKSYPMTSSLGLFYSLGTLHLGFLVNSDEYKVMGLAPYGSSEAYEAFFKRIIHFKDEGEVSIPQLKHQGGDLFSQGSHLLLKEFSERLFLPRNPKNRIEPQHKNFSAALQKAYESCLST